MRALKFGVLCCLFVCLAECHVVGTLGATGVRGVLRKRTGGISEGDQFLEVIRDWPQPVVARMFEVANMEGRFFTPGEAVTSKKFNPSTPLPKGFAWADTKLHTKNFMTFLPADVTTSVADPPGAGFRRVLSNIVSQSEARELIGVYDSKFGVWPGTEKDWFDTGKNGGNLQLPQHRLPSGLLQRVKESLSEALFGQGNATHPLHYLAARLVKRSGGGSFFGHVDNGSWDAKLQARLPLPFPFAQHTVDIMLSDDKDYTGGSLSFLHPPTQPQQVHLLQGQAAAFSSGPRNAHRVEQITSGSRYALVVWFHQEPFGDKSEVSTCVSNFINQYPACSWLEEASAMYEFGQSTE